MANQRVITLRAGHATPANIVLQQVPLADVVTVVAPTVVIYLTPRTPTPVGYSRARAAA